MKRTYPTLTHSYLYTFARKAYGMAAILLALTASVLLLVSSCSPHKAGAGSNGADRKGSGTHSDVMVSKEAQPFMQLMGQYQVANGEARVATADSIFALLLREEMTDSLITASGSTPADSLNMLVWYWAGEYLYATQDYAQGLRYAEEALPLTYTHGDPTMQSDCENLVGIFCFRLSDYQKALFHISKCLEIDTKQGDKSRMSSSLNTLAGICLAAKQLDEAEKYILKAISYCKEANDSDALPIRYGMASEIYHAKGQDRRALSYARRAYEADSLLGNKARTGIRLSQMAVALMALKQNAQAEQCVRRAMPILEKAGNNMSLSICQNQMGELLNRRGAHAEAATFFRKAAEACAVRGDKYNESRAQMGLYEALKKSDPSEAGQHLMRYATLQDSIYQHDMEQAVSQYNVKYNTQELENKQAQERLEKRNILFGAIALTAVLLLIVATGVYTGRVRRRNHIALKKLAAMREQFFTNITHEFRTPLTVILGLSHDLEGYDNAQVRDKAQVIERQGKSLLELVNQLLDIAKVKSAVGKASWRNGNIIAYLTMVVESYRSFAQRHNIQLQFLSKGEVVMDFVPDYAKKVMNNLLSNAFKFTPQYGKISVAVWSDNGQLYVDVSDTGQGMDKATLAHVFEPFYQAESDSKNIGTGLGLAYAKQIIDAVEGSITVESKVGRGTTFHLSIPIRNKVKQTVSEADGTNTVSLPEGAPELTDSHNGNVKCRLLIIDDNRDIAAYIGAQFVHQYAISYATNGKEGLDKALDLVPDLIITDLMMPGMDGLEVCRQVRANDIINHIPIIIVTAKITEEERISGLKAGADAYLTKPFNADELHTRVEKLLEGRRLLQQKYGQATVEHEGKDAQNTQQLDSISQSFLAKVADAVYIQLSRDKSTDVSLIASQLCMSSRQFHRKIVALTGYTPIAYIQLIKIKKARILLDSNPQMSFAEIADMSGFNDYSNFVRAFKNVMGITPTEYRQRAQMG